jgi:Calcineurin-like phosphoesterase
MMSRSAIRLGLAGAIAVALSTASGARFTGPAQAQPRVAATTPPCAIQGVERIVAVGDVHGAYDRFVQILQAAGLLDQGLRWVGGRAHLVQLGDVVDRGPDSRKALDLIERLQGEAQRSGGAIHALLGNHEVMRMLGDLRYVSPGEYEAFVTARSERVRGDFVAAEDRSLRERLLKDTPLGFVEMRVAFGRNGHYGEWLRTLNVVVKINGVLFVHGGLSPGIAGMSCDVINAAVRLEMTTDIEKTRTGPPESLSAREDGPLWYRGLAEEPEALAPSVDEILARQNARAIVIGHTVTPDARIRTRFGGKVVQIDTGMQPAYVASGRASALDIRDGVFTAIYTDRRDVLFTLPAEVPKAAAIPQ